MENNNDFFGSLNLDLNISDINDSADVFRQEESDVFKSNEDSATKERLSAISKKTFQLLDDENIFPFPENFESIFERVLKQEQDENVRNKILKHMQDRDMTNNVMQLERNISESFSNLKSMIEQVGALCQNLNNLECQTIERIEEIEKIDNHLAVKNAMRVLLSDFKSTCTKTFDELHKLAKLYAEVCENAQEVKKNTMFDSMLGTHNKDFFMSMLAKECQSGKDFATQGVIFVCELAHSVLLSLPKPSQGMAIKMGAKILNSQVGKTDSISYIGNGLFAIFMKNISREQADKIARTMLDSLKNANVFINNSEISLAAVIGAIEFDSLKGAQENIDEAKNALTEAKTEQKNYKFKSKNNKLLQKEEDPLDDFANFDLP